MEGENQQQIGSQAGCPVPGQLGDLLPSIPLNEICPVTQRWEPQQLRPRHREIMRRILEGATYSQIAEQMGLSYQAIMLVCTSKLFKEELNKLESTLDTSIIKRADELSGEALDVIKTKMRWAKSEALQVRSAERILDTAGYSKVEKKIVGIVDGEAVIRELNKIRREKANVSLPSDLEVVA